MEEKMFDGGLQFVPQIAVQKIYLDFDGEQTHYDGEILTVENVEVKAPRIAESRIVSILSELNARYAEKNVEFVTERPEDTEFSTIYIGRTNAFEPYGNFTGLAETVDENNAIKTDNAFVILDSSADDDLLISTISHEADHLLGFLDHGGNGLQAYASYANVSSGTSSSGLVVHSGDVLTILNGASVTQASVDSGAVMVVNNGASLKEATISSGGRLRVERGGIVQNLKVQKGGELGGISFEEDKTFEALSNGSAILASNVFIVGSRLCVSQGGVIDTLAIHSGGTAQVFCSGTISNAVVKQNGQLHVLSGGSADDSLVNAGGSMLVSAGASAQKVTLASGGFLRVQSKGNVENLFVNRGGILGGFSFAEDKNFAALDNAGAKISENVFIVNSSLNIASGGVAREINALSGGRIYVSSGGNAVALSVLSQGYMYVSSGGTASGTVVSSGGSMTFLEGAALRGVNNFGGSVNVSGTVEASGGTVNFALGERSVYDACIVNDLSRFSGADFSVTVSSDMVNGEYKLSRTAENFTGTITVKGSDGTEHCSLKIGENYKYQNFRYNLSVNTYDMLVFNFEKLADIDVTMAKPAGWEEAVVISTTPGNNISNSVIYADQEIYLDVALSNTGSDAAKNFYAAVYVDGVFFKTLSVPGSVLNGKASISWEDIKIGKLAEGKHTLEVVADHLKYISETDEDNNSRKIDFTVLAAGKDEAPVISSVSIEQQKDTYSFAVKVSASDDRTPADSLTYQIRYGSSAGNLENGTVVSGLNFSLDTLAAGKTHYYQVGVTDLAGQTTWSAAKSFVVRDETDPVFNGTPSVSVNCQKAVFSWTAASDNLGIKNYKLIVDDKEYTVDGTSFTLNGLALGEHTFKVAACDAAGNTSTFTPDKSFAVTDLADTIKPVISNVSLTQGEKNYSFTATVAATDDRTKAENLSYQIKYAATQEALAQASPLPGKTFTLSDSAAGKTFYYQVGVADENGNMTWSTVKDFYVEDVTAPIFTGVPKAEFANNTVTISWSPANDNVNVAGYHLLINGKVYDVQGTSFVLGNATEKSYTYQLSAYDVSGNESAKTAAQTLRVGTSADLTVTSIKVYKDGKPATTVSTEDKITLYISVKNIGETASKNCTAQIYCGEVLLGNVALSAIEKGATSICTHVIEAGSMSTGVQDIFVKVDTKNSVQEYDEENNEKHLSLLVENRNTCDLVIDSIALEKEACTTDEPVKVTFAIKNIGYITAEATKAYIYDGEVFLGSLDVPEISAGAVSGKLTYTIPAGELTTGSHAIRVVADGESQALEINTVNNSATAVVTIGGVDLSISKLTLSKDNCNTGEDLTVNFTIRNSGIVRSGAFKVGIYDGEKLLGTVDVDGLEADISVSRSFVIKAGELSAGKHELRVQADSGNTVVESDESNNSRTTQVDVTLLDTTAPVFDATSIAQGSENYTFTVSASAKDNVSTQDQLVYKIRYAKTEAGLASAASLSSWSFNLSAGDAGDTWYYQVSATDAAGNTSWSAAKSFVVADKTDPVFGNISVTTKDMTLKLSWNASDNVGVTTYKVYFDDTLKATQTGTTYTLSDIGEGDHSYRIEAFDAAGNMVSTGNISVRFDDTIAPKIARVSIAQTQDTYNFTVTPSATDNSTAAAKLTYKIQYAFSQADVASATAVSGLKFSLNSSDAGKTLYYRVNVADEAGNNIWSSIQSVAVSDFTAPGKISGLKDTVNGTGVTLDWADASDNVKVAGYYVRYGKTQNLSGNGTKVTASQQELSNLSAGKYYWQVRAVDAAGNMGEWSTVDDFTILAADPFENNDTAATAYNLGTLNGEKTLTGGAIASAGDADYFKFTIDSRGTANDYVQLSFNNSLGDVDLYLYSANGSTLIKSSNTSTSGTEKISLEGLSKGTYILKAVGKNGAMNTYTLSTKKVAGYDPDIYDANSSNNTRTEATVLNIDSTPQKTVSKLNLHEAGDTDFYQFTLSNMGVSGDYVSIDFQNSVGDLDLVLYNGAGSLVQKSEGNGNSEKLNFSGLAAGTYYVQVKSPYNHVNEYSLNWKFTPNKVNADRYEGKEPIAITETTSITGLTISASGTGVTQQDTFKLTLPAVGNASSKITFSGYRSDWNGLKYTVKNSSNTTILSGTGSEISLSGLAAGNYTVTVDTPVAGSYGEYSISVNMPEAKEINKWTYLVYMDADSGLDSAAMMDIIYMQQAQLDDGIDIYIIADRGSNKKGNEIYSGIVNDYGQITHTFGLWTDTRVGKIEHSAGNDVAVDWISWGEMDMSSVSTLEKFINWGMEQSEAENYGLIMWDHGAQYGGLCVDYTSGREMTMSALADTLSAYDNIPLVIFNNCLLGTEICVTAMEGVTDVIVVSEPISWGPNTTYNYLDFFSTITADMSAVEMGTTMASLVNPQTKGEHSMLSVLDVSDNDISKALTTFGNAAPEFIYNDWFIFAKALFDNQSTNTNYSGAGVDFNGDGYIEAENWTCDLLTTIQHIKNSDYYSLYASSVFKRAVNELETSIKDSVYYVRSTPENTGTGIAIFNTVYTAAWGMQIYGMSGDYLSDYNNVYLSYFYKDMIEWASALYTAGNFFIQEIVNQSSYSNSVPSSFGHNTSMMLGNNAVTVTDWGCFSGKGIQMSGIYLTGEKYFTLDLTERHTDPTSIAITADIDVKLDLISESGVLIRSATNNISLSNLNSGTYIVKLYTGKTEDMPVTGWHIFAEFESEYTTGTDRFDYKQTKQNQRYVNGNFSVEKADQLVVGNYTGLVSYKGDSDWYQIGNIYTAEYMISISGSGLTVAEYDAAGNLVQTAEYTDGKYTMTMKSMNYLYVEGNADISKNEVNSYSVSVNSAFNTTSVVEPEIKELSANAQGVSWQSAALSFTAELSQDAFRKALTLNVTDAAISSYGLPAGNYQWRVKYDGSGEWTTSESFAGNEYAQPQNWIAEADKSVDVFFANASGTWESDYAAQHLGTLDGWGGTRERAALTGKNKLADVFTGSTDANVLVLTDDANGDALFVDDIYTALGDQARLSRIDEIRAGAGDDIIDLTSQRYALAGSGVKVYGGDGNDTLWANSGSNTLFGDAGDDRLVGAAGNDVIIGGSGNDTMQGGGGDDIFFFGANWGVDTVQQLAGGRVTLHFENASESNWNAATLTYTDGVNSVTVSGVTDVVLKFGETENAVDGAFSEAASQMIFEDKNKGMIA